MTEKPHLFANHINYLCTDKTKSDLVECNLEVIGAIIQTRAATGMDWAATARANTFQAVKTHHTTCFKIKITFQYSSYKPLTMYHKWALSENIHDKEFVEIKVPL